MKAINQKQEHTGSYYAATANEITNYPVLEGSKSADICVVGAGFTGVSTALALAERGYSVAIVEANRVSWGASGRNGGHLINGISGLEKIRKKHGNGIADTLWDLRWRGNDIIYDRVEKYAIDCDLKSGFVETALKPRHLNYLAEYYAERGRHDFPYEYELWDKEKTCSMLGTDAYIGGFACYRDGHLHPLNLCLGEARAARGLGVQIFEQSPVTGIEHGDRPIVKTATGSVTADAVVLAGNAYSLMEPKHLSNLVFPAGSYIIATEPLSEEVVNEINPGDLSVCDANEIVNYYRLSADKRMLFGGTCNYSGRDPASIKKYVLPRMLKVYPQLKDVQIEYEWGGGVSATHAMSEVVADAIVGTMEKFDLFANMKHFRIPGSQWMGNQIIALGMLYYKLGDLL